MNRLLTLFVQVTPWIALLGGLVLLVLAALHIARVMPLPGVTPWHSSPALATLLLGAALSGLGGTYLYTEGRTDLTNVYLFWLGLASLAALVSLLGGRGRA